MILFVLYVIIELDIVLSFTRKEGVGMLPIILSFDSGLRYFERLAVREAVAEFRELFPEREIQDFGSSVWSNDEYSCADWYIEHAQNANDDQLEAKSVISLMKENPHQSSYPHIEMLITSRDLTTWYLDFCFGLTVERYTVQSVYRHRELKHGADNQFAIKAMIWHELGHLLGAASDTNRSNTEDEVGVHCTNFGCIMQNSMTSVEMVRHAKDAMWKKSIYCPQCIEDIRRAKI